MTTTKTRPRYRVGDRVAEKGNPAHTGRVDRLDRYRAGFDYASSPMCRVTVAWSTGEKDSRYPDELEHAG